MSTTTRPPCDCTTDCGRYPSNERTCQFWEASHQAHEEDLAARSAALGDKLDDAKAEREEHHQRARILDAFLWQRHPYWGYPMRALFTDLHESGRSRYALARRRMSARPLPLLPGEVDR